MALLETQGLGVRAGRRHLCAGLTWTVARGEVWAVLGPNGAGKTSLLHAVAGLLPPEAGRVFLEGRPLDRMRGGELARRRAILLQDSHDPFPATVHEQVLTGRHPHLGRWQSPSPRDHALADAALAELGLAGMGERWIHTLSGGERRRASLAAVLVQGCPLLLLDEPLGHLDWGHQVPVLNAVRKRAEQGHAAVMVLHDPNLALRHADHALLLFGDGRHQVGPCAELMRPDVLRDLYRRPVGLAGGDGAPVYLPL